MQTFSNFLIMGKVGTGKTSYIKDCVLPLSDKFSNTLVFTDNHEFYEKYITELTIDNINNIILNNHKKLLLIFDKIDLNSLDQELKLSLVKLLNHGKQNEFNIYILDENFAIENSSFFDKIILSDSFYNSKIKTDEYINTFQT